jgi:hypothetical protein
VRGQSVEMMGGLAALDEQEEKGHNPLDLVHGPIEAEADKEV